MLISINKVVFEQVFKYIHIFLIQKQPDKKVKRQRFEDRLFK